MPETYNPSEIMFQEGIPHQEAFPDAPPRPETPHESAEPSVKAVETVQDSEAAVSRGEILGDHTGVSGEWKKYEIPADVPEHRFLEGRLMENGTPVGEKLAPYPEGAAKNKEMEKHFLENPSTPYKDEGVLVDGDGKEIFWKMSALLGENGVVRYENWSMVMEKGVEDEEEGLAVPISELEITAGEGEEFLQGEDVLEAEEVGALRLEELSIALSEEESILISVNTAGIENISPIFSVAISDSHHAEMARVDGIIFTESVRPDFIAREIEMPTSGAESNVDDLIQAPTSKEASIISNKQVSTIEELKIVAEIRNGELNEEEVFETSSSVSAPTRVEPAIATVIKTDFAQRDVEAKQQVSSSEILETKDAEITRAIEAIFQEPLINASQSEEVRTETVFEINSIQEVMPDLVLESAEFASRAPESLASVPEYAKAPVKAVEPATSKAAETAALNSVVQKPIEVNKNIVAANDNEVRFVPAALSPEIQRAETAETLVTSETKVIDLNVARAARGSLIDVPEGLRRSLGIFVPTDVQESATTTQQRVVRAPIIASQRGITMVRRVA